jgi:two-component system, OmpR family, phosphate regulon response regulator PhoB
MSMASATTTRRDTQTSSIKPRVLIVEDETALVELLRYNLEQSGFRVSVAYDGEEALASVQEDVPDLMLLDWMLPLMSGIEVCRQLRRQTATANLPIIMLTARGEEGDRVRGLDAGADDYVSKPFSPTELVARIRAVLRRIRPALADEALNYADIVMDLVAHRVTRAAKPGPPSSACCATSWSTPAACSRASSFSTRCGARTSMSRHAPSTSISAACASR